jgi:glutathione S-transferase
VVVFTRPGRDVARLDVAVGPCIPPPTRKRPLVGVTNQEQGDERRYEALYGILVRDGSDPWEATTTAGEGRLHVFSDAFVQALAEVNRQLLQRIDARPKDDDWIFEPTLALAEAWFAAIRWPDPNTTPSGGVRSELVEACAWARVARERSQKLYCWSGPGFNPWVTPERIGRLTARLTRG